MKPGFIYPEENECQLTALRKRFCLPLLQGPTQRQTDTQEGDKGNGKKNMRDEVGVMERSV